MRKELLILLLALVFISACSTTSEDYIIDGDAVYWENEHGEIRVSSHTCSEPYCIYHAEITTYLPSQNFDFAFQFDEPVTNPHIWEFVEGLSYDIVNNETGLNETFYYDDWVPRDSHFHVDEYDGSTYYWVSGVPFTTNETKYYRWGFDNPGGSGKWELMAKRSSESLQDAIDNGNYINLDPWWDAVTEYCRFADDFENVSLSKIIWAGEHENDTFVNDTNGVGGMMYFPVGTNEETSNFTNTSNVGCWEFMMKENLTGEQDGEHNFYFNLRNGGTNRYQLNVKGNSQATWQVGSYSYVEGQIHIDDSGVSDNDEVFHKYTFCQYSNESWSGWFDDTWLGGGDSIGITVWNKLYRISNSDVYSHMYMDNISYWVGNKDDNDCRDYLTSQNVTIDSVSIVPSPAYVSSQLNCSVDITYNNRVNVSFLWFNNSEYISTFDGTRTNASHLNTIYTDVLVDETLIEGGNWTCQANVSAFTDDTYFAIQNSSEVMVLGLPAYFNHSGITIEQNHTDNLSLDFNCTSPSGLTIEYAIVNISDSFVPAMVMNDTEGTVSDYDLLLNHTGFHEMNVSCADANGGENISLNITVLNNPPEIPTQTNPLNNSLQLNTTALLFCNSTDIDGDQVHIEFYNGTDNLLQNSTLTNYSWSGLSEGATHNWSCQAHDTENVSGFSAIRNVKIINATDCTFENATFNLTLLREIERDAISGDFEAVFNLQGTGGSKVFDLTGNSNFKLCFDQNLNLTEAMFEYSATSHDPRQHYLFSTWINSSIVHNIDLHLLNISLATGTTFEITDASGNPLEGAYIYIERYYVGENAYRTIAMGKTDENGEDFIFLRHDDAWYRYKVYYDDELVFTSERKKVTEDTEIIRVGDDTWEYYQDQFGDVQSSLTFDDGTLTFTTSFSTTSGLARNVCQRVTQISQGVHITTDDSCVNAPSGTIQYTIPENTSTYHAETYLSINPINIFLDLWYEPGQVQYFGILGVLIVVLLIVFITFIGAQMGDMGVAISLMLSAGIILGAKMLGVISLGQGVVVAILTLAGFIIVRMGVTNR